MGPAKIKLISTACGLVSTTVFTLVLYRFDWLWAISGNLVAVAGLFVVLSTRKSDVKNYQHIFLIALNSLAIVAYLSLYVFMFLIWDRFGVEWK